MREYMRRQYALKKEDVNERNRAYYAKNKHGTDDDLKRYDKKVLPIMVRIKKELDKLNAIRPNLIINVLELVKEYDIDNKEINKDIKENNKTTNSLNFNTIEVASDCGDIDFKYF
jgi:hypothetical protein